ncbi:ABC transporter permease [Bacteroidota bacterium]
MNLIRLSLLFWINKPYSSVLNALLIAVPVAIFISVGVLKKQITKKLLKQTENVDLILGAPGNPVQITMSGIFFIGNSTGTISVGNARELVKNRAVRLAVPVILGDYYNGFRMIGTNNNYLDIHNAELRDGRIWNAQMEVVIGYTTARKLNIEVGDIISMDTKSNDNLSEGDIMFYQVVGVLEKTRTVLDKVILTSVESFWDINELVAESDLYEMDSLTLGKDKPYDIFPFDFPENSEESLSCVLIQYRSPMAALTYPKNVKREPGIQPVTPAIEILRLNGIINQVSNYFIVFAYILIGIIGFSVVQYFKNMLKKHETDFAVFRATGCSRYKIIYLLLILAMLIADTGAFTGIIFGHISAHLVSGSLPFARIAGITGWSFYGSEILVYLLVHLLTLLMASYSAIKVYQMDVKSILTTS